MSQKAIHFGLIGPGISELWLIIPEAEQVVTPTLKALYHVGTGSFEEDAVLAMFPAGLGGVSVEQLRTIVPLAAHSLEIGQYAIGNFAGVLDPVEKSNKMLHSIFGEFRTLNDAARDLHINAIAAGIVSPRT